MKAARRGGNKKPKPRQPYESVDVQRLSNDLESYIHDIGPKHALNLHYYNNCHISCAVHGPSLVKLNKLLHTLLLIQPTAEFKYADLRAAMKHVKQVFGHDVFHATCEADLKPGKVADQIQTMCLALFMLTCVTALLFLLSCFL